LHYFSHTLSKKQGWFLVSLWLSFVQLWLVSELVASSLVLCKVKY
jgi:hypothetical protein